MLLLPAAKLISPFQLFAPVQRGLQEQEFVIDLRGFAADHMTHSPGCIAHHSNTEIMVRLAILDARLAMSSGVARVRIDG
jgi:hypothetical protein